MKEQTTVIDKIRKDTSEAATCRREIAALATLGLIDFSLISLFQMGYIKNMPDVPGKLFNTEKVNTSRQAVLFGLPDGVTSLAGYTASILLATAAIRYRKQSRILDMALGAVVLGQAAGAAKYLYDMAFKQKKVCVYCVAGAVINFASIKPLRSLFKRRD
ncbi:putative membrane protein [Pontibacter ummariensis]|uniref:Uncharacterized membrane protein n=1 Tax=Pontibacter ummariensis TaxID=1610492 RepID=A0A239IBY7_9BACT|nr:vitamin K epoxide reductase family protein [Pontibacter ummariensis]PRY09938.1 putative membrane protein [Pontibacter ummariensis]SNS91081.1 Uncharacterized membrane protein [Pontibacter ummariensis]